MHLSMDNILSQPHTKFAGCMLYSNVPVWGPGLSAFYRANPCGRVRKTAAALEVIEYGPTLDTTSRFPGNILKGNISFGLL